MSNLSIHHLYLQVTLALFLFSMNAASQNHLHTTALNDSTAFGPDDSIQVKELQEFSITAKRPHAVITADKISYRPAEMISGQSNVYEAIKSLPGINVDSQGNITLNGVQHIAVYIDGRKSILSGEQLLTYLRATPTTDIEKIDILTTFGSKTEGSDPTTILNLQKATKKDNGYTLGMNLDGQLGRAKQFYGSMLADYKQRDQYTSLVYSNYIAHNPSELLTDRPYLDCAERLTQSYDRLRKNIMHNISLSYDYKPTSPLSLATTINYNYYRRYEPATMYTQIPLNPITKITTNTANFITKNLYGEMFLKRNLSVPQSYWTTAIDFFNYHNLESQLMEDNSGQSVDGRMSNRTYGIVGSFDWQRQLSSHWLLSWGSRISYVHMKSCGVYSSFQDQNTVKSNSQISTHRDLDSSFGYNENVNALYVQSKATYGIVNISGGIRTEFSNLNTNFSGNESAEARDIHRHYFHIYPSVNVSLTPQTGGSWLFTYTNKVVRPRYADLDPFIHIFDDITHVGGNINLKASTSHAVTLAWSDNRKIRIAINGEVLSDEIVKCYRELTDKIVYVTPENLPRHLQGVLSISVFNIKPITWWEIATTSNLIYSNYHFPKETGISPNILFTPTIELKNMLNLPFEFSGEVKVSYRAPLAYGQVRVDKVWNSYIGIRKNLLNGKLGMSLYMTDIFNSNRLISSICLANRKATLTEKEYEDMRKVGISLSYSFSGGKSSKRETRNTWFDELNRVNL